MPKTLAKNAKCPIHGGYYCCGRERLPGSYGSSGITVLPDGRQICTPAELRRRIGGGKHDDRWENLCLMHRNRNREQGSRSLADYLKWRMEKRLPVPADVYETLKHTQIHAVEA